MIFLSNKDKCEQNYLIIRRPNKFNIYQNCIYKHLIINNNIYLSKWYT